MVMDLVVMDINSSYNKHGMVCMVVFGSENVMAANVYGMDVYAAAIAHPLSHPCALFRTLPSDMPNKKTTISSARPPGTPPVLTSLSKSTAKIVKSSKKKQKQRNLRLKLWKCQRNWTIHTLSTETPTPQSPPANLQPCKDTTTDDATSAVINTFRLTTPGGECDVDNTSSIQPCSTSVHTAAPISVIQPPVSPPASPPPPLATVNGQVSHTVCATSTAEKTTEETVSPTIVRQRQASDEGVAPMETDDSNTSPLFHHSTAHLLDLTNQLPASPCNPPAPPVKPHPPPYTPPERPASVSSVEAEPHTYPKRDTPDARAKYRRELAALMAKVRNTLVYSEFGSFVKTIPDWSRCDNALGAMSPGYAASVIRKFKTRKAIEARISNSRRLPPEVVWKIVNYIQPDLKQCLALRAVSRAFRDAVAIWQRYDADRILRTCYGPEQPTLPLPESYTWLTDDKLLEKKSVPVETYDMGLVRHALVRQIAGERYANAYKLPRLDAPSSFRRWIVLKAPRAYPSICLGCGIGDFTVIPRAREGIGRFCDVCYEKGGVWLRWRLQHWIRGEEELKHIRDRCMPSLDDTQWREIVPVFADYTEMNQPRYLVNFTEFRRVVESWTDTPIRTLVLELDGRWKVTRYDPDQPTWPPRDAKELFYSVDDESEPSNDENHVSSTLSNDQALNN
jgi:hypothetical protein